ncbi:MAG: PH domain-containing protein [Candidatus Saccharibacteria bacterium]|nr:PH domain-containing protein [Candidatus Saccharibacteria bacterium]
MKKELAQVKHARSAKDFPEIDLEENEYVVLHIKRAPVGVAMIWIVVGLMIFVLSLALITLSNNNVLENTMFVINSASLHYLRLAILTIYAIVIFAGFVGQSIYNQNQMYITNLRAVQKQRTSLFANSTNIIKLSRIEDVSWRQKSLFDHVFNIGTLRMSTVGEETTYTFPWLATPQDEVKIISHLVAENHHGKPDDK